MILRRCVLRQGRQAIAAAAAPFRTTPSSLRPLSTTTHQPPLPTATAAADPPPPASSTPTPVAFAAAAAAAPKKPTWKRQTHVPLDESIADNYRQYEAIQKTTGHLGATVTERFDPSSLLSNPPRPEDVTLELLMASQTHMGHHASLWNPENQRYIYGVRAGIHIISLEETAAALRRAAKLVEEVAFLGGLILFVGNRKGQMEVTARAAELAGGCHLFTKWIPGTITNRDQILGKEELRMVDEHDKTLTGFEKHLLERRPIMPDLVVVLNPLENFVLLHECAQENIPTIGLVDTDADPTKLTYIIPGNDDSLRSVSVIAGVLGRAGERGQKRRRANANEGICTWANPVDVQAFLKGQRAAQAEKEEGEGSEEQRAEVEAGAFAELGGSAAAAPR